MDPRKFDALVQELSEKLSRRSVVGGSVGASLLAAAGLGGGETSDDALAKGHGKGRGNGHHHARAHEHDANAEHKNHKHKHHHKKKKKKCKKVGQSCNIGGKKCCKNLVCSGGICVSLS
jgi:hypothetical protein